MKLKIIAPLHYFYDHPRDVLPETIQLETNFLLKKFDRQLIQPITDFFTDLYSGHDIRDLENCKYCAIYDFESSETETKETAQQKVHQLIESLRVVRPTRASCSIFIFGIDNEGNLRPEGASQKSSTIYLTSGEPGGSSHFITGDELKIKRYYKEVSKLYKTHSGSYNRILNAFIFFQLGYLIHYAKLRIVPFTTALESLFNTSEQEVGYSLRMRCTAFLGESNSEKEEFIKKIKSIYDFRSSVVHGSSMPKQVLRDPNRGNVVLRDAENICRRCLQKIFDDNLIDFFSQSNERLSQDLDKIVIGD